mgnify:CR=1 FL=1
MGERHICTEENPWKEGRGLHPDAIKIESGDEWDEYQCPHCKLIFKITIEK